MAAGGRYIDPDLADRMVFEVGLTDARPAHTLLSEREFSVFERLVRGEGVNEIAQQLAVSSKTVSTHKARLMQKLGLHSVADLVKYAVEHKLL
ncbi:Oxygen regulatory protein NreC [compost metagenome]